MALVVRIKPRAQREIERAAEWWAENRPAAVGAVRLDIEAALALLVEEPGIGTKIETTSSDLRKYCRLTMRSSRPRTRVKRTCPKRRHFGRPLKRSLAGAEP